jgi:hypothetical protein
MGKTGAIWSFYLYFPLFLLFAFQKIKYKEARYRPLQMLIFYRAYI